MKDRIRKVRGSLTAQAFSDKIGISRQGLRKLEEGISKASEQTIRAICNEFGVSRSWLVTGEGDMYDASPADLIAQVAAEHNLGEGGKMLLRVAVKIFERLGPEALDQIVNETMPAIMAERGITPAALAAERAEPLSDEAVEAD